MRRLGIAVALAGLVVGLLAPIPISAMLVWTQVGADIGGEAASDGASAVAMSAAGTRIVVGASLNDGTGPEAGHVRVFELTGTAWVQLGSDIDGEAGADNFGISVGMSAEGNTIVVGADANDGNGTDSGHVRVYSFDGTSWSQVGADIDGEAAGDGFGHSVAMSDNGTTIVAGARLNDDNGVDSGHARVFSFSGTAWVQDGGDIDGEKPNNWFGTSVAMSADGTKVIVGAELNSFGFGLERIFSFNGTAWVQVGAGIDGEASGDRAGLSVGMSDDGNTVIIGSWFNSGAAFLAGHARVFSFNGTSWVQVGADIDGVAAEDVAGFSVAISADGNTVIVASPGNDANGSDSGHARVFEFDGSAWVQVGGDLEGDSAGDSLATRVAMSADGKTVALGAPQRPLASSNEGYARVYAIPIPNMLTLVSPACLAYDSLGAGDPALPGSGAPKTLQITGICGVASDATSVVVTVTARQPAGVGNLRLSASGASPSGGVVNYITNGLDQTNTVTVPLSGSGAVDVAANGNSSHVRVVVVGYYSPTGTLRYNGIVPCTTSDSRGSEGASGSFLGPFGFGLALPDIDVVGVFDAAQGGGNTDCGVPSAVDGVVVNVVAIETAGSSIAGGVALGAGGTSPTEPTVNSAGIGLNNAAVAYLPVDASGKIAADIVGTGGGAIDIRLVVLGYVRSTGASYTPVNPCTAFDSRDTLGTDPDSVPTGGFAGKRASGAATTYNLTGPIPAAQGGATNCAVPEGVDAVLINLVGVQPSAVGNLRAYANGATPSGGVLNFNALIPPVNNANAIVVPVSASGDIDLFVNSPPNSGTPTLHARGVVLGYYNS